VLVISRKVSESIIIGDDVEVVVTEIGAERVKIGIRAPKGVPILRRELLETRDLNREASAASGPKAVDELKRLLKKSGRPKKPGQGNKKEE
jgi:carbon storage regulator